MGWLDRLTQWTGRAVDLAQTSASTSIRAGKALLDNPERLERMARAGKSLRELRQVAGLTLNELAEAIDLKDKSLLEAVEAGTATLSFDLIMRLASVLARNDPIPFVLKYTRTYSPDTWKLLEEWGIGRLPVQYERERRFLNILRSRDDARDLSDKDFDKLLTFTESAFDMALHFAGSHAGTQAPDASASQTHEPTEQENPHG